MALSKVRLTAEREETSDGRQDSEECNKAAEGNSERGLYRLQK